MGNAIEANIRKCALFCALAIEEELKRTQMMMTARQRSHMPL